MWVRFNPSSRSFSIVPMSTFWRTVPCCGAICAWVCPAKTASPNEKVANTLLVISNLLCLGIRAEFRVEVSGIYACDYRPTRQPAPFALGQLRRELALPDVHARTVG